MNRPSSATPLEDLSRSPPVLKGFFTSKEAVKAREKEELLMAAIFFGPGCLNQCSYCCYGPSRSKQIKSGKSTTLSMSDYLPLLDESAALGVKTVFVPGEGEPTLAGRGTVLLDFIDAANKRDMYVVVISSLNPTPGDYFMDRFKELNASLIAKLESFDPATFSRILNPLKPYQFVKIDEGHIPLGLHLFLERGFAEEGRLGCGTVLEERNYREAEALFRFYRNHRIFPFMQKMLLYGWGEGHPELQENIAYGELFKKLCEIDQSEYGFDWNPRTTWAAFDFNYPMFAVRNTGTIEYSSAFRPDWGNVKTADGGFNHGHLTKVMNSPIARLVRRIDFPIGRDEGCSPGDHSQCEKILLDHAQSIDTLNAVVLQNGSERPNNYCVYAPACNQNLVAGEVP